MNLFTGKIDFSSQDIAGITKELETFKLGIENLPTQIPSDKIDESIKLIQDIIDGNPPGDPTLADFVSEVVNLI